MRHPILLLALCLPFAGMAKDLGTWGDVYPVQEQSFLSLIHNRLQAMKDSGQLTELERGFQDRVKQHTLRPAPVDGLLTDTQPHTLWYDPTFTVGSDIADLQGHVFAHKGETVNPLSQVPMASTLYFIDADDSRQVAWMKAQTPPTLMYKVILVKGNIREAADALAERIYFDQQGDLTRKLGVKYIPAVVSQDGMRLKIVSAAMKESRQ